MSTHAARPSGGGFRWHRPAFLVSVAALIVAGSYSAMAGLNATAFNSSAQQVTTATMSLTLTSTSPSAGFTTSISNLAPGDTIYRYVTLTNGTLAGQGVTLQVSTAGGDAAALITNSGKALEVAVSTCSTSWSWANTPSVTSSCSGSATALSATPLSTLASAQTLNVTGGTTATLAASATAYLRIAITLPDQNETTTNGALPSPSASSVQGKEVNLTFQFSEAQRDGTTVNG